MDTDRIKREIETLDAQARVTRTPCGDEGGTMPFRCWGRGDETLVLVHGGSGSWTHWIRNIPVLAEEFEVIVPDLPGLGGAATLPEGYTAEDTAHWFGHGLAQVLQDKPFHLIAFSWGCTVSSLVAKAHADAVLSMLLIGPAAMGMMPRRSQMQPLIKRTSEMSEDQVYEANRENLSRLMIHDRDRIDDLAVYLQTWNTNRARFNSPQFALSTIVLDSLRETSMPLSVIYGEYDAPAYPNFDEREKRLGEVRPDLQFDIIDGAGHWLQYEVPDVFNRRCLDWIKKGSGV